MARSQDNSCPLISVVMASYKGDPLEFLQQAVESILGQTYTCIEFLIVLDGEISDAARRYLDDVAAKDRRMRLLALPVNMGPAHARNAGIREARGTYVAIFDSDDVAVPDRLEKQFAFIKETGADLVGSFYRLIDERGSIMGEKQVPTSPEAIMRWLFLFNPIANPTVLARAEVLKQNPYPEHHRPGTINLHFEDYDLWVTLLRRGFKLCNQPAYLVNFRIRPRFLRRRSGLSPFYTDLKNKLRALPLYKLPYRPLVFLMAFGIAGLRLLPAPCLAFVYRARNRLRFAPRDR